MAIVSSYCFSFFLLSLILVTVSITDAEKHGFSVELIHRDSLKSPFHNPLDIPSDRAKNALRRSISRAHRFANPSSISLQTPQSDIIPDVGEYLMNISIGTPPSPILAVADTGSDLIWTQCSPCVQCFKQEAPLFAPMESSTYKNISCFARQCGIIEGTDCSGDNFSKNACVYSIYYGDGSYSNGFLSSDTITLGSTSGRPVAFSNTIFGCGNNNFGSFDEKATGIIGLGWGAASLISQMGGSIDGKFSYCLVPRTHIISTSEGNSSKINFGSNGIVLGASVVSTPLVKKSSDTFYYLTLLAITVDNDCIELAGSSGSVDEGNIVIDSGTTLTILPQNVYSKLEKSVSSKILASPVGSPVPGLSLCYKVGDVNTVPEMTANFKGADVKLKPLNIFVKVSEEVICFAFASSGEIDISIYGNLSQMDFLVGYDTRAGTVSFKPTSCAN